MKTQKIGPLLCGVFKRLICKASLISSLRASTRYQPNKRAGIWVIREKLSQVFSGQFFFYNTSSHDDSFKVGLVRACVAVQTPHRLVQFTGVAV